MEQINCYLIYFSTNRLQRKCLVFAIDIDDAIRIVHEKYKFHLIIDEITNLGQKPEVVNFND